MTTVETPRLIAATITANGALVAGKHTPVDATAGPLTVTLPTVVTPGAHLSVEKSDASSNTVTVSGTIRGTATTTVLALKNSSVTFVAENSGTSWTPTAGRIPETALAPYATASSVAATYVPFGGTVRHTHRLDADHLPKWRQALARVRNGSGDAKLLCAGDSTVWGSQSSILAGGWPSRLSKLLNTTVTPAAIGFATPPIAAATDTRWTAGSGWPTQRNFGFGQQGWNAPAGSGALVYADPRVKADRFDVYFMYNYPFGTATITATGGTPTSVDTSLAGSGQGVSKVTVSAATAATTNSVSITPNATGGDVWILGVEPWLSTAPSVRVGNAGVPSSSTSTWDTGAPFGSVAAIGAYAPDLTIFGLGVNDAYNATDGPTFQAQLQPLIDAAAVSGDVILLTPIPSQSAPYSTWEPIYTNVILGLPYPVVDLAEYTGGYTAYNALGFMGDDRHPNDAGYWDIASLLKAAFATV